MTRKDAGNWVGKDLSNWIRAHNAYSLPIRIRNRNKTNGSIGQDYILEFEPEIDKDRETGEYYILI
mgnify:CR=1 FL=1